MDKPIPEAVMLEAFRDAMESAHGYRPQVFATGVLVNSRDADRFEGYQLALTAAQRQPPDWYARREQHAREMGYTGLADALDDLEKRRQPDHIVDANKMVVQQLIGWTFQHDETGRISLCPNDGVNTPENFAANNPRYTLCGPAYSAPQRQQQGQAVACGGCGNADPEKVCIGCLHPFAAPPSAPVGVEVKILARDVHYAIRDDGLAPASPADDAAMRNAILRVLASSLAQQPAAVDEAMLQDIADATAALDKRGDRQMASRLMRLHARLLATQHQEPTT